MYTGRGRRGAGRSLEKLTYLGRQSWHGQTEFTKELIKFLTKIYFNKSVCAPLQRTRLTPVIALFIFVSSPPSIRSWSVRSCSFAILFMLRPRLAARSPDLSHIHSGLCSPPIIIYKAGIYICVCVGQNCLLNFSPCPPQSAWFHYFMINCL